MSAVTNAVVTAGKLLSWNEGEEVFTVTWNGAGRPSSVESQVGRWLKQQCTFNYTAGGEFSGFSGTLSSSMLANLLVEAEGVQSLVSAGGGSTNLSVTLSPTGVTVNSDTGTDATLSAADATNAGLMLPAQFTKLAGIAAAATANATDAALRDRSTHTGTQLAATIGDFATAAIAAVTPASIGAQPLVGTYTTAAALQTAKPAASNTGALALVGSAAPYTQYVSTGAAWSPVSGGVGGVAGARSKLAIIGDSRMAQSQQNILLSSMTITGRTATVGSTGIGDAAGFGVGQDLIVGNVANMPYMRMTVASRVSADSITATVQYPTGAILQGVITVTGVYAVSCKGDPALTTAVVGYAIPLSARPFESIKGFAFPGAKTDSVIQQARDAIASGCDEFWVTTGFNDYNSASANTPVAVVKEKYKQLWSILRGNRICHFYENPVISPANTAGNLAAISSLNAFIASDGPGYGVVPIDVHTPMHDVGGIAKAGYINSGDGTGVHYMPLGALRAAESVLSVLTPATGDQRVNTVGQGTVWRPIPNPAFFGTVGVGNGGTCGYSQIKSGTVVFAPSDLLAKADGTGNELVYPCTGALAGDSVRCETPAMAVTAGARYRYRARVKVSNAVGLSDIQVMLVNALTPFNILETMFASGNNSGVSDLDGSREFWFQSDVQIPVGITSVLIRVRPFWDAAGSADIRFSDFDFESI